MDKGNLLWATSVSHQKRKKQKRLSTDAATNEDHGAFFSEMMWPGNVKDDGQQKTAVLTNVSHLKREKRKKSTEDAATNGDPGASILRNDVA